LAKRKPETGIILASSHTLVRRLLALSKSRGGLKNGKVEPKINSNMEKEEEK